MKTQKQQCIVSYKEPKSYLWKPKEDITAYELALCLPVFQYNYNYPDYISDLIERLPLKAGRHFLKEEDRR